MAHESAQQRYRRQKRDPFRAAQIAPKQHVEPVRCRCSHARLLHQHAHTAVGESCVNEGCCLSFGCECTEYVEASGDA